MSEAGYRKSVGAAAVSSMGGGGGGVAESSPSGDFRLQDQIRAAWNKGRPATGDQKTNLFFQDAKSAVVAIKKKEVDQANAPQIAYNLGLIGNSLDTTARAAMDMLTKAAQGKEVKNEADEHDKIIREAAEAAESDGEEQETEARPEKHSMTPEEWKAEVARRRTDLRKSQQKKAQKIRLIPAGGHSPDALTGNGLNHPDQGAGKEEVNELERNNQTEHSATQSDALQTTNLNAPAEEGHGAPSRHSALDRVQRLERELEAAKAEAVRETGIEKLIGRLRTASLTPDQIVELNSRIDQFQDADLYSEGQLDSVVSGLGESFDEVVVSDDDIAEYLSRTGRTE